MTGRNLGIGRATLPDVQAEALDATTTGANQMRNLKDNYADTVGQIHAIMGTIAVRGAQPARLSDDGGRIEFRRGDTNVDLYVRIGWGNIVEDKDGSIWSKSEPEVEVSYPSHSNKNPATVLMRAALITEVALLAVEIQSTLPEQIYKLRRSAEEVAHGKKVAEWRKQAEQVEAFITDKVKGMRVEKIMTYDRTAEMMSGWYNIGINGKEYAVVVTESQVTIARVS